MSQVPPHPTRWAVKKKKKEEDGMKGEKESGGGFPSRRKKQEGEEEEGARGATTLCLLISFSLFFSRLPSLLGRRLLLFSNDERLGPTATQEREEMRRQQREAE